MRGMVLTSFNQGLDPSLPGRLDVVAGCIRGQAGPGRRLIRLLKSVGYTAGRLPGGRGDRAGRGCGVFRPDGRCWTLDRGGGAFAVGPGRAATAPGPQTVVDLAPPGREASFMLADRRAGRRHGRAAGRVGFLPGLRCLRRDWHGPGRQRRGVSVMAAEPLPSRSKRAARPGAGGRKDNTQATGSHRRAGSLGPPQGGRGDAGTGINRGNVDPLGHRCRTGGREYHGRLHALDAGPPRRNGWPENGSRRKSRERRSPKAVPLLVAAVARQSNLTAETPALALLLRPHRS